MQIKFLLILLVLLAGCNERTKPKTDAWCFESDCHAGHACGTKFGRVIVPIGKSPTLEEAQKAKLGLTVIR